MMFRPRESHDLRLLEARLTIAQPDGAFILGGGCHVYHFSICLGFYFKLRHYLFVSEAVQ